MCFLILIMLLLVCIIEFRRNKKIYTPIFAFNFMWFITLGLYEIKLSTLQQDLSNRTLLIFLICVLSFNITCFIMEHFKIIDKLKIKIKKNKNTESLTQNKFFNIEKKVKIAKYIAIIVFIVQVIYSKGVPLFWKLTGDSKTYFDFGITSLNGAWYGLIICLGAYSFFSKSKDKYIYLLFGILILSRQVLISIVLEAIIFNIIDKDKKINYKKYVIIILILFIGFSVLGNIRSGSDEMDKIFYAKEQFKNIPTSIKWTYSYMTFSISNFNNLVHMTDGCVNYGVSMLKEFVPNIILNKLNIQENYAKNFLILPNFNVSTYLPALYLDFGILGIAIFNIIIGIVGMYLYNQYNDNNSVKNRLLYSVFIHNIIFLFFINMFLYLPIIIQFIYIYIIFSQRKDNKDECYKTKIYIATHKKVEFPKEKIYSPIQVGAEINGDIGIEVKDNIGDNISNKNKNYCELTALYWIWKNSKDDIIGLVHYRRYFFKNKFSNNIDSILFESDIKDILVQKNIILPKEKYFKNCNLYEQYKTIHNINDLLECKKIIEKDYPEYLESFESVMAQKHFYPYNMFIAKKEIIDNYFEWLFDILEKLESKIDISNYDKYNARVYGFLSERLFNVWINKNITKNMIKEINVNNIEENIVKEQLKNTVLKIYNRLRG